MTTNQTLTAILNRPSVTIAITITIILWARRRQMYRAKVLALRMGHQITIMDCLLLEIIISWEWQKETKVWWLNQWLFRMSPQQDLSIRAFSISMTQWKSQLLKLLKQKRSDLHCWTSLLKKAKILILIKIKNRKLTIFLIAQTAPTLKTTLKITIKILLISHQLSKTIHLRQASVRIMEFRQIPTPQTRH